MVDKVVLNGQEATVKPGTVETPKPTWFFKRPDGSVFACDAKNAWFIVQNRNHQYNGYVQLGCSDGKAMLVATLEAHAMLPTQGLAAAQARLRQGHEEELANATGNIVPPPDPDVIWRGPSHGVKIK